MNSSGTRFHTRELTADTYADFTTFFQGSTGCACALYLFGRHLRPDAASPSDSDRPTARDWRVHELTAVEHLLHRGLVHGILVYADREPVGWCNFGRAEELPVTGKHTTPKRMLARDPSTDWRITCLLTKRSYRRQGVAMVALEAAVAAIRRAGGGWIEALPTSFPHRDLEYERLRKVHGAGSVEVTQYIASSWPQREVPGVGSIQAFPVSSNSMGHTGTSTMFERLGFEITAIDPLRDNGPRPGHHLVMRMRV